MDLRFGAGYPVTALQNDLLYLGNSMRYYTVACVDAYQEEIHTILVEIADQDLTTGEDPADPVLDDFYDWEESL